MSQDSRAAKKPYSSPSFQVLDPVAARVKLIAQKTPPDDNARKILAQIEKQIEKQVEKQASGELSVALSPLPK